ncbi:MAG: hypothetical protein VB858_20535, partial [Planctomycetaceae bacterium]
VEMNAAGQTVYSISERTQSTIAGSFQPFISTVSRPRINRITAGTRAGTRAGLALLELTPPGSVPVAC